MTSEPITFSLIIPAYNRVDLLIPCIKSVLTQSYEHYEIIVVDDGSTDNTETKIHENFQELLDTQKLKYVKLPQNSGVCTARNVGLQTATNEWICYLDSDNSMLPSFFTTFVDVIKADKNQHKIFYAQIKNRYNKVIVGKPFSYAQLCKQNFIDMNVLVHHRTVYEELGGFDTQLKRLVDWDLVLTYTKTYIPVFIPKILVDYNDNPRASRITTRENRDEAFLKIAIKHGFSNIPQPMPRPVYKPEEKFF